MGVNWYHKTAAKMPTKKESKTMSKQTNTEEKTLEQRIAEAKARLAANSAAKPATPTSTKRRRLTDAEKQLRDKQIAAEKEARKAAREAKKAERLAAQQNSPAPHTRKVQKAIDALPELNSFSASMLNDAKTNLTLPELALLASHVDAAYRFAMTERSAANKPVFEPGDTVTVVSSSDPRLLGRQGTVTKMQLIRAYVRLDGDEKETYFFTGELQASADEDEASEDESETDEVEATGTEG